MWRERVVAVNTLRDGWANIRGWWGTSGLDRARHLYATLRDGSAGMIRRCSGVTMCSAGEGGEERLRPGCLKHGLSGSESNRGAWEWGPTRAASSIKQPRSCDDTAFSFHRILQASKVAGFNRRMRKTACPVVWEVAGAIPSLDLISSLPTNGAARGEL